MNEYIELYAMGFAVLFLLYVRANRKKRAQRLEFLDSLNKKKLDFKNKRTPQSLLFTYRDNVYDAYEVLEVSPHSQWSQIERSYKRITNRNEVSPKIEIAFNELKKLHNLSIEK